MIPGFCLPSAGGLGTIQKSVFVIATTPPAQPREGGWARMQGDTGLALVYSSLSTRLIWDFGTRFPSRI